VLLRTQRYNFTLEYKPGKSLAISDALSRAPLAGQADESTLRASNINLCAGERIVILRSMRADMKRRIHSGHLGISSCLRRARDIIFWPGMTSEIRQFVESCTVCATYCDKQPAETLIMHETCRRPWEKVGTDLFTIHGRNYLVTVDYCSHFFEIDFLPDTMSETVVTKLKHHFARHGIPDVVLSDGGPQYTSSVFKAFSEK
jgi:Integrase zinc binding domain